MHDMILTCMDGGIKYIQVALQKSRCCCSSPFALRDQQQHAAKQVIAQLLNVDSPLSRRGVGTGWCSCCRARICHIAVLPCCVSRRPCLT